MRRNFAYETYKNVEAPRNFRTPKERRFYTRGLLEKTKKNEMPFLRRHLPRVGNILEIGSGSGRILHALLLEGRAERATGVEISPSRVRFGTQWARDLGLLSVRHIAGDVLSTFPTGKFDAVLCMTSIYPFFDMLQKNGLRTVLRKSRASLSQGGYLVLESVTFAKEIAQCRMNGGRIQLWEEYAAGDPFRYHLVEYTWDEKKRHLFARSYNIMRDRLFVDGPTEKRWHIQTAKSLRALLKDEGFTSVHLFGDFDSSPYREGKSPRCVIVARI